MSVKYDAQITDVRKRVSTLLEDIVGASQLSLEGYQNNEPQKFKDAQKQLSSVNNQGDFIDNEIIKTFALFGPEANELRSLVAYLKMTNEMVRIGESVKKYARRIKAHLESECDLELLNGTIIQLHKSTIKALEYILECFKNFDDANIQDYYTKVMVEESKSDDLFSILEKEIMTIIINEKELSQEYVKVLATLRKLERLCDRSVHIASLMVYAKDGGEISVYS